MTSPRIPKRQLKALLEYFREQPHFRKRRGRRHALASVLTIVLVARLAGRHTVTKMARCRSQPQLRRMGARRNPRTGRFKVPSLNTIRRVLAGLDIEQLERDVDARLQVQGNAREPLGMDGKCLKGSYDHDRQDEGTHAAKRPQQQISIVSLDAGQVYAQQGYSGLKKAAEGGMSRGCG